jgi:hypothetical protein
MGYFFKKDKLNWNIGLVNCNLISGRKFAISLIQIKYFQNEKDLFNPIYNNPIISGC